MKTVLIVLSLALLVTCTPKNTIDDFELQSSLDSIKNKQAIVNEEVVNSILEQIPSPLEISVLLKESGVDYNSRVINSPSNISRYHSTYQKALNLGIYGADLGYTNIYGQNAEGIRYLTS